MERKENTKPMNEIRIGFQSRVRNIINYANVLLKENNFRVINLSAIGGAIGSLVNAVEVIKINNPGLYQVNKIGTVSHQTVDNQGSVQNQRYYPKLEVVLTLDEPKDAGVGFQDKLSEEERAKLLAVAQERRNGDETTRGGEPRRGRGTRGRGRGRGNRGGYRPPREEGGYRPPREEGGYRAPREEGGYRAPREEGGYRPPREEGGYRPPREEGGFRGRPRGGFGPRGRGRGFPNRGRGGERGRGFSRPYRGRGGI